jgi:transcription elongation factor Elf1
MTKYIYESKGVECPECGETTNQLFNTTSKSGQEVLLCDACRPANDNTIKEGWEHGGINE